MRAAYSVESMVECWVDWMAEQTAVNSVARKVGCLVAY